MTAARMRVPQRQVFGPLDVELDLFPARRADIEQEGVIGGQVLPVQEVHQLPSVDGQELVTGTEPEFGPKGARFYRRDT